MRNAGLEEAQAGVKIAGRNIHNLKYAEVTTLMAEGEEEPKSLLIKVKEDSYEHQGACILLIFFSDKYPGLELLDHIVVLFLSVIN